MSEENKEISLKDIKDGLGDYRQSVMPNLRAANDEFAAFADKEGSLDDIAQRIQKSARERASRIVIDPTAYNLDPESNPNIKDFIITDIDKDPKLAQFVQSAHEFYEQGEQKGNPTTLPYSPFDEQEGSPDTLPYRPYEHDFDGDPTTLPYNPYEPGEQLPHSPYEPGDGKPDFIPIDTDPGFIKVPDLPEEPGDDHKPSMGEIYAQNHPDPGTVQSLQKALENNNKVLIGGKFYDIPEGMDLQEKFGEPAYPDVETCLKANQTTGKDGEERDLYGAELSDELKKYGFMMGPDGAIYQLPDDYEPEDDGFTRDKGDPILNNIDTWEYNETRKMDDDQRKEYREKSNHVGSVLINIHGPAIRSEPVTEPERHISDTAKDRAERAKEALGIYTDEPDVSHILDSEFSDL